MTATIALYYKTFKALEAFARDLEAAGLTDSPMYREYEEYKQGYELARAEMLESLGIAVR